MAARAGPVLVIALQLVDEVTRLPDSQLVGRLESEAIPEQADEIDPPTGRDRSDGLHLGSRGGTGRGLRLDSRSGGAGLGRDRGAGDGRARAHLDDLVGNRLRLGLVDVVLAVLGAREPGDLVLDGFLTGLVRPLHDELEAVGVVEEGAVEFGLDGAGGRRTREARQADLLRDASVELEHGVWLSGDRGVGGICGGGDFDATAKPRKSRWKSDGRGCREAWAPPPHSTPVA